MTAMDILPLVLLGALIGFDTVSFPQAMLSRPIVAATLGGAVAGNAGLGLLCGAVLECFALETLPVGASRYPEWGSASVVGGALFADSNGAAGALVIAVAIALGGAWLGGWSMIQLRVLNARRARRHYEAVARGEMSVIRSLQLGGLAADLLRAAALTAVVLAVALPLRDVAVRGWTHSMPTTRLLVAACAIAVALSAVWKHFSNVSFARPILFGALATGVVLYLII